MTIKKKSHDVCIAHNFSGAPSGTSLSSSIFYKFWVTHTSHLIKMSKSISECAKFQSRFSSMCSFNGEMMDFFFPPLPVFN